MKCKIKTKKDKIILKPEYNEVFLLKEGLQCLQSFLNFSFINYYNNNVFDKEEVKDLSKIKKNVKNIIEELNTILDCIHPY